MQIDFSYSRKKPLLKEIQKVQRKALEKVFFERLKKIDTLNYNILNYYGVGGAGKTTLKKSLLAQVEKKAYLTTVSVDMENGSEIISVNDFFIEIEQSLKTKVPLYYFSLAYTTYFQKKYPKISMESMKVSFFEEGSLVAELFDSVNLNRGLALTQVLLKHSNKKIFKNKEYLNEIKALEEKKSTEIEEELAKFLFYDIEEFLKNTPKHNWGVVFFFDVFEYVLSNKRMQKIVSSFFQFSEGLHSMFVLTGRDRLSQEDDEYLTQVDVSKLQESESREFLESNGVSDSEIVEKIIQNSQGVVLYLEASLKEYNKILQDGKTPKPEDFEKSVKNEILLSFLKYFPESDRQSFNALALVKRYDYELFEYIRREFMASYHFDELLQHSFVEEHRNGFYSFHKLMQESLIATTSDEEQKYIHKKFYDYFRNMLEDKYYVGGFSFVVLLQNTIYHALHINNEALFFEWFFSYTKELEKYAEKRDLVEIYVELLIPLIKDEGFKVKVKLLLLDLYIELNRKNEASELIEDIKSLHILPSQQLIQLRFYEAQLYATNYAKRKNALHLFDKVYKKSSNTYLKIETLFKLLQLHKNQTLKKIYFEEVLEEITKVDDEFRLVEYYRKLANNYLSLKNIDKAKEYLEKSYALAQKILPDNHPHVGDIYYTYAGMFYKEGEIFYRKYLQYLLDALKIYENVYIEHDDILKVYKSLARMYIQEEFREFLESQDIDLYKLYFSVVQILIQNKETKVEDIESYLTKMIALFEVEDQEQERVKLYKKIAIFGKKNNTKTARYFLEKMEGIFQNELSNLDENSYSTKLLDKYREIAIYYNFLSDMQNNKKYLEKRLTWIDSMDRDRSEQIHFDCESFYATLANQKHLSYEEKSALKQKRKFHLEKLVEFSLQTQDLFMLEKLYTKLYKTEMDFKQKEYYLLLIVELYIDEEHFISLDKSYSALTIFYENYKKYDLAHKYYKIQLELREKNPYKEKIAKGYGFYGKFLAKHRDDLLGAEYYFLKEIEVYDSIKDIDALKLVTAYRTLGDFYQRYDIFDADKAKKQYEKALLAAYNDTYAKQDGYELLFFMLFYLRHPKLQSILNIQNYLDQAAKFFVSKNEYFLIVYKLYPLYVHYYKSTRQEERSQELTKEVVTLFVEKDLTEKLFKEVLKDAILVRNRDKTISSKNKDDINSLARSLKNSLSLLDAAKKDEYFFQLCDESLSFYKHFEMDKERVSLLVMWESKLVTYHLSDEVLMQNYGRIANGYIGIDKEKYFYFFDKYLDLAQNSAQSLYARKLLHILGKAKEYEDLQRIQKYEKLYKELPLTNEALTQKSC